MFLNSLLFGAYLVGSTCSGPHLTDTWRLKGCGYPLPDGPARCAVNRVVGLGPVDGGMECGPQPNGPKLKWAPCNYVGWCERRESQLAKCIAVRFGRAFAFFASFCLVLELVLLLSWHFGWDPSMVIGSKSFIGGPFYFFFFFGVHFHKGN